MSRQVISLKRLFGLGAEPDMHHAEKHALLIRIDASGLSGTADDIDDLADLEDHIQKALGTAGEVDGHDIGTTDATIYCYGPNAVRMFELIKPTLEHSSLASEACITLRFGSRSLDDQHQFKLGSTSGD